MSDQDDKHYSIDEIDVILTSLSQPDLLKLGKLAKLRGRHVRGLDPQDLLQETIGRIYEGTRRWPRKLEMLPFMDGSLRSVASQYYLKVKEEHAVMVYEELESSDQERDALIERVADTRPGPPDALNATQELAQELKRVEGLFQDDERALEVLMWKAEGYEASEIRREMGITQTEYDSTITKIRRRLLTDHEPGA